jgi:hypothetical protein
MRQIVFGLFYKSIFTAYGGVRVFLLCVWFMISPTAMAGMSYHGFYIDDHLLNSEQRDSFSSLASNSVIRQLNIVESVGLSPEILEFFKGIKILVDPDLQGNPGFFSVHDGKGIVRVQPIVFAENRPILLHELLHAYHYYVITLKNPVILNAYDSARYANFYPLEFKKTHFLSNEKEFFAVTSTIYLFGKIQQPPFNCEILAKNFTQYLEFLENTFGLHRCN